MRQYSGFWMMSEYGWLLVFGVILPSISCANSDKSVVFCDDVTGKFTALAGNLVVSNVEFPIMATSTASASAMISDLAIPKQMHPCFSLSSFNNYKNQMSDIFNHGDFAATVCERQCAHFVDVFRLECGDRRPPPTWLLGSEIGPTRKINCSDWAIPITAKGVKDGIQLTFTYGHFVANKGINVTPPYTLNNMSIAFLDTMFIKGFHLKPVVYPAKEAEALTEMEDFLEMFTQRHPEIIHVAFGNQITFFGDASRNESELYPPRFIPTSKFWKTLADVPSMKSLALAMINITGQEEIPSNMNRNLQSIGFYNVALKSIPSWIQTSLLQFLEFSMTLTDTTDISGLDNLPELEHFILTESDMTKIKSPFLAKSTKLLSLTLQCNALSSIASGAFDHFTELKYLNLAGNRFTTLPENLLINLNNLLTLDLKALDNSTNTIQTYDELTMQCQINMPRMTTSTMLDSMPTVPNPGNIIALDIRGQSNFLKNEQKMLGAYKNLEILNLGNLGLSSIQNISLEALCNLNDLNLIGNPLNGNDWLPESVFINLNLQRLRLGKPTTMSEIPDTLIAYMRTASQIMYSTPQALNFVDAYRNQGGCEYAAVTTATMFGYQLQNESCKAYVKSTIDHIRSMELEKMETECQ